MSDQQLVVVCGSPGVGKTTVARVIADQLDAVHYRTDVVRTDILDDPDYTSNESWLVYGALLERARDALDAGESVVLDGTFRRTVHRDHAVTLAGKYDASLRVTRVTCEEETVRERIAAREGDASDADFEIHQRIREEFEPIERPHDQIDNSDDLDALERAVADRF